MTFQKIDWTDEVIEEFWRYWRQRPEAYFTEALGDTIVRLTRKNRGDLGLVLDFGSGTGGLLAALSRAGNRCHGLDFGNDALRELTTRFSNDPNIQGIVDLDGLSELGAIFDTVFLIETIEHLPDRHLDSTMKSIFACLKPGGYLIVSTPNNEDILANEVYCPISKIAFHPMQHLRSWNTASLSAHLAACGFDETKCMEIDLTALPSDSFFNWVKGTLKRNVYKDYQPPQLFAITRKPTS